MKSWKILILKYKNTIRRKPKQKNRKSNKNVLEVENWTIIAEKKDIYIEGKIIQGQ